MPPKGRRGSDFTMPLTKTAPASMRAASLRAAVVSALHREAPRPNCVSLAIATASSAPRTLISAATGRAKVYFGTAENVKTTTIDLDAE